MICTLGHLQIGRSEPASLGQFFVTVNMLLRGRDCPVTAFRKVISAQYPAFSSPEEWCKAGCKFAAARHNKFQGPLRDLPICQGFDRFLDAMKPPSCSFVGRLVQRGCSMQHDSSLSSVWTF